MTTKDVLVAGMSCFVGDEQALSLRRHYSRRSRAITLRIDPKKFCFDLSNINSGPFKMFRVEEILAGAIQKALDDAQVRITARNAHRCAIIIGNTYGSEEFKVQSFKAFSRREMAKTFLVPYSATNVLATKMSILFRVQGPNITFSSGLVSGSEAILVGSDLIKSGKSDIVIVGGVNFFCSDFKQAFHCSGFKQESCAFVILKKDCGGQANRHYNSISRMHHGFCSDQTLNILPSLMKEIAQGERPCHYDKIVISRGCSLLGRSSPQRDVLLSGESRKNVIFLEDMLGNTFCSSGILGVIASSLLLRGKASKGSSRKVLFINQDYCGGYVSMVLQ